MMILQSTDSLTFIYVGRSVPWYEQILSTLNRGIGLQSIEATKQ